MSNVEDMDEDLHSSAARSSVLFNEDLLREIASFIRSKLPFILSFKLVRKALKPINFKDQTEKKWIKSYKNDFLISVKMLQWAQSYSCKFSNMRNNSLCVRAASIGSIEVLSYVFHRFPLNMNTLHNCLIKIDVANTATLNGQLKTLQFLRSMDSPCEWSRSFCENAVRGGHLDILKWLRSQDPPCPWDPKKCLSIVNQGTFNNKPEILNWILAQVD